MSDQSGTKPGGPAISSAKKRRLAALEQSLSGAAKPTPAIFTAPVSSTTHKSLTSSSKQDKQQQQQQNKRKQSGSNNTVGYKSESVAPTNGQHRQQARNKKPTPCSNSQIPKPQLQVCEAIYEPLPDEFRTGPVAQALGIRPPGAPGPSGLPAIMAMFEELLSNNPRPLDVQQVINTRLKDKVILLENPVGQQKRPAAKTKKSAASLGLATRSFQKKAGLYNLKDDAEAGQLTYAAVQPLHKRWQLYFKSITESAANLKELHQRAIEADLHGCLITVSESNQARLQGVSGIVVRDTQQTLQLITEQDRVIVVPKKGCTFEFRLDHRRAITLLGSNMVKDIKDKK